MQNFDKCETNVMHGTFRAIIFSANLSLIVIILRKFDVSPYHQPNSGSNGFYLFVSLIRLRDCSRDLTSRRSSLAENSLRKLTEPSVYVMVERDIQIFNLC